MKKSRKTAPILFLLLMTCMSTSYADPQHPLQIENVEQHLEYIESQFSNITENTEKTIVWANETKNKTPFSIVYLHGYSASRQETMPLSKLIAEQLHANIFYTRLAGHGRDGAAMATASVDKWLADATQAWEIGKLLGDKVIFISASTGGTLSTWLSAQDFAEDMYAQIMISPNFDIAKKFGHIIKWPLGLKLAKLIIGDERSFEPSSAAKAKYWTYRYPIESGIPLMGIIDLVETIDKAVIKVPTLIIFSPNDQVIDTDAIRDNFAQFGSSQKQLVEYLNSSDPGQHVLAGDIASPNSTPELVDMIMTFLQGLMSNKN